MEKYGNKRLETRWYFLHILCRWNKHKILEPAQISSLCSYFLCPTETCWPHTVRSYKKDPMQIYCSDLQEAQSQVV